MWGSPWAGSEELWAKTAQRALQTGFRVSICLSFRPHPKHKKLEDLESAGADVFCFADSRLYVRARQFSRVAGVLHRPLGEYLRERLSPLPAFFSTRPDVLLISDGGCIPSPAVMEAVWKHHLPRPYLILNQGNWGEIHGQIPSTVHRKKAAAFYQDARFALFVSESNLRATERQLTQRLVNARGGQESCQPRLHRSGALAAGRIHLLCIGCAARSFHERTGHPFRSIERRSVAASRLASLPLRQRR